MAFRTNHVWQLKPGRLVPEALPLLQSARTVHARHGAEVSAWMALLAGPNTGRITYTLEYPDQTAFGKSFAAFGADPDWAPLWQKINGPESPISLTAGFSSSSFRGIDDPATPVAGPRIRSHRLFRIEKGGNAAALPLLVELRTHQLRLGISRVRVVVPVYSGEVTAHAVSLTEYAGFVNYGETQDRLAADPAFQEFLARFGAAGSPFTFVASGLSSEIPLV